MRGANHLKIRKFWMFLDVGDVVDAGDFLDVGNLFGCWGCFWMLGMFFDVGDIFDVGDVFRCFSNSTEIFFSSNLLLDKLNSSFIYLCSRSNFPTKMSCDPLSS